MYDDENFSLVFILFARGCEEKGSLILSFVTLSSKLICFRVTKFYVYQLSGSKLSVLIYVLRLLIVLFLCQKKDWL